GAGRSAVSGLMPRRLRTISFTRAGVTPMARASALLESPSGCMKSACRISPGWTGGSVSMETSVIVHDLDIRRTLFGPGETQPELLVDADAVYASLRRATDSMFPKRTTRPRANSVCVALQRKLLIGI